MKHFKIIPIQNDEQLKCYQQYFNTHGLSKNSIMANKIYTEISKYNIGLKLYKFILKALEKSNGYDEICLTKISYQGDYYSLQLFEDNNEVKYILNWGSNTYLKYNPYGVLSELLLKLFKQEDIVASTAYALSVKKDGFYEKYCFTVLLNTLKSLSAETIEDLYTNEQYAEFVVDVPIEEYKKFIFCDITGGRVFPEIELI